MSEDHRKNKKNVRISDDLYEAAAEKAEQLRPKSTIRNIVEYALEQYLEQLAAEENNTPYKTKGDK